MEGGKAAPSEGADGMSGNSSGAPRLVDPGLYSEILSPLGASSKAGGKPEALRPSTPNTAALAQYLSQEAKNGIKHALQGKRVTFQPIAPSMVGAPGPSASTSVAGLSVAHKSVQDTKADLERAKTELASLERYVRVSAAR